MAIRTFVKKVLGVLKRRIVWPVTALWARIMALGIRPPAFLGAFPDRKTAIARVPKGTPNTYDDDDISQVNFELMTETQIWDYPILFWLERLARPGLNLLDAGGHFGTKYIAFRDRIDLGTIDWTVYDLPATVRAATRLQASGVVPEQIKFTEKLSGTEAPDILLASGLLQYLDVEFHDLIAELSRPPKHILLNKVATTDGPTVVTLEKIGEGRVPYKIRNRPEFERSLSDMGYLIRDTWHIPNLARTISTHPWLGASTSLGYVLEHAE